MNRSSEPPPVLREPLENHAAAVGSFLRAAGQIAASEWDRPQAAGKWSAAEVLEHVRLSFEVLAREVRGGSGMRVVVSPWKAFVLRHLFLPRILRTGRFPRGSRAPKEVRPTPTSADPREAMARLRAASDELSDVCARVDSPRSRRLTHAYFGPIPLPTVLRLLVQHTRHHQKQLAREPRDRTKSW
jgi:DinB superfamily